MRESSLTSHEWILKRNCSLRPGQLLLAYAILCGFSLAVSLVFAAHGAWQVLCYAALEIGAVAWAFLHYCRHVNDCDRIVVVDGWMTIEQVRAEDIRRIRLNPCWTRIGMPKRPQELIRLESRGSRVELGRFVTDSRRRQVARELRDVLLETAAFRFQGTN